jgi:pyruvate/2-oxoglutarate/acetoin dehydrogenase E1 component
VAEIQYLDYLIYGLQTLSDDVATTYYRTAGKQVNPLIIRTRGHRLEGIWHSGSYIGMLVHALRGMIICVPRNMTQAAGFYNHLVELNDPALVIEPLKAYSFKEKLPQNLADYKTPIGVPEVINEGNDITLVTYGYSVYLATQAAKRLQQLNISMEVIDVQTLLPFDNDMVILESLKKTNKIIFLDEDVPGGTTGYMMQKVLEDQGGYGFLDSAPRTISAKQHRPPFGSVGDYHSKPNEDDVFECAYQIMSEYKPDAYPEL